MYYNLNEEDNSIPTHEINVAGNMVFYTVDCWDLPSYSYWMIPGTWN